MWKIVTKIWRRISLLFLAVLGAYTLLKYKAPQSTIGETIDKYKTPYCKGILRHMVNGRWKKKEGLTKADEKRRARMDVFLRTFRGIPENLTRDDSHCGSRFPVAAPTFGPSLPSMCKAASDNPCCNDKLGFCGNGYENCKCTDCTDFREIISPELYNWVPMSNTCQIRYLSSHTACEIVSSRLSNLTIVGDSLMRHMFNGLMLLFTGDKNRGAHTKWTAKNDVNCEGERQFVDKGKEKCRRNLAKNRDDIPTGKFCQGSKNFGFKFNESYSVNQKEQALVLVRKNLRKPNSVVVFGLGLHESLIPHRIMDDFMEPILQLIGDADWPKLIWVTTHAHGFLKPAAYRKKQSNKRIIKFNKKMRELLEPRGVAIFDVNPMTRGVYSYDGTHYGMAVNIWKAQFLVNYIQEKFNIKA